jgi:hypothetical protein
MKRILTLALLLCALPLMAQTTIAVNNSNIVYSPYNWNVTGGNAIAVNAGAYFRVIFSGTSISLTTNTAGMASPYAELTARIDGGGWQVYSLSSGNPTVAIASGLENRKHLVEVMLKSTGCNARWTSPTDVANITSIVLDSAAAVYAPIRRTKNILIYGDSITEGTLAGIPTASLGTDQNDVRADYSFALTTAFDAEVGIVGFGGQGMQHNSSCGAVPMMTSTWNYVYAGVSRVFSPAPDLVIYNQGQNDGGSGSTAIAAPMETIVAGMFTAAPAAKQLALIPFSGASTTGILLAVSTMNDARFTYVSTSGWLNVADASDGVHPYGYAHLAYIAPMLFPVVNSLLYPAGSGGGANVGPVGFVY